MPSVVPQLVAATKRNSLSLAFRGWVILAALLIVGGVSSEAFAKCGASSRQMIWRMGSTSELLNWNGSTARQAYASSADSGMESSEHGERECTRCRCRKEGERPLYPDLDLVKTSQQPVVSSRDAHCSYELDPSTGVMAVSDATFSGCSLDGFERPPRFC